MDVNFINDLKQKAVDSFAGSGGCHDLDHTLRVYRTAQYLQREEGGDADVIAAAVLLHDIGRAVEEKIGEKRCHAELGAAAAREILAKQGAEKKFIDAVCHAIRAHRFRNSEIPQTIEAKIVFDADKLDSIGAIGIGRAFLFAGAVGARLHNPEVDLSQTAPRTVEDTAWREYSVKLKFIKEKLFTESAGRLAAERSEFMSAFFRQLDDEHAGRA